MQRNYSSTKYNILSRLSISSAAKKNL